MKCCLATELNLLESRARGLSQAHHNKTRLFPEYLPRILKQREKGETWEQIGKRWGVKASCVSEFVAREGRKE